MAKTFYQQHCWDEYFRDTPDLDLAQHGAYLCLRGIYWQNGGPLPDDLPRLQRIMRAQSKADLKNIQFILGKFFKKTSDGAWAHHELDEALAKLSTYRQLQAEKSAKAVGSRKKTSPAGKPVDAPTDTPDDAPAGKPVDIPAGKPTGDVRVNPYDNDNDNDKGDKPPLPPSDEDAEIFELDAVDDGTKPFDVFWQAYPKHQRHNKPKCAEVWKRKKLDARANEVIAGVLAWKASKQWQKDAGEFVPWPQKFLNSELWASAPKSSGPVAGGGMAALAANMILEGRGMQQ